MAGFFSPVHLIVLLIVVLPIIVLLFGFWLWMLVDCLKNPRLQGAEKIFWVLVIIFMHALGALVYLLVGRTRPA
jgi:hypothetical protein